MPRGCFSDVAHTAYTVKPTVPYRDVGSVIQKHATQHGLSVVRAFCGHGVNGLFHATPNIPHYASAPQCLVNCFALTRVSCYLFVSFLLFVCLLFFLCSNKVSMEK